MGFFFTWVLLSFLRSSFSLKSWSSFTAVSFRKIRWNGYWIDCQPWFYHIIQIVKSLHQRDLRVDLDFFALLGKEWGRVAHPQISNKSDFTRKRLFRLKNYFLKSFILSWQKICSALLTKGKHWIIWIICSIRRFNCPFVSTKFIEFLLHPDKYNWSWAVHCRS